MIQSLFGPPPEPTIYERFEKAVAKTRTQLVDRLDDIFQGKKEIDEDLLEELEMVLITADIGVRTTDEILSAVRDELSRNELKDPSELKAHLAKHMANILDRAAESQPVVEAKPQVVLVVGVNGTGKTTTIGKLAYQLKSEGKSVLLCAADTFRAAAVEQLTIWAQRLGIDIVTGSAKADPASVAFKGVEKALTTI